MVIQLTLSVTICNSWGLNVSYRFTKFIANTDGYLKEFIFCILHTLPTPQSEFINTV